MDLWLLIPAAALLLGALAVGVWWLRGDPSGGRKRCPRCWYDIDADEAEQCPECGRTIRKPADLVRTRRSKGRLALALLLLAPGAALGVVGTGVVGSAPTLVPTSVLVANRGLLPMLGRSWELELLDRELNAEQATALVNSAVADLEDPEVSPAVFARAVEALETVFARRMLATYGWDYAFAAGPDWPIDKAPPTPPDPLRVIGALADQARVRSERDVSEINGLLYNLPFGDRWYVMAEALANAEAPRAQMFGDVIIRFWNPDERYERREAFYMDNSQYLNRLNRETLDLDPPFDAREAMQLSSQHIAACHAWLATDDPIAHYLAARSLRRSELPIPGMCASLADAAKRGTPIAAQETLDTFRQLESLDPMEDTIDMRLDVFGHRTAYWSARFFATHEFWEHGNWMHTQGPGPVLVEQFTEAHAARLREISERIDDYWRVNQWAGSLIGQMIERNNYGADWDRAQAAWAIPLHAQHAPTNDNPRFAAREVIRSLFHDGHGVEFMPQLLESHADEPLFQIEFLSELFQRDRYTDEAVAPYMEPDAAWVDAYAPPGFAKRFGSLDAATAQAWLPQLERWLREPSDEWSLLEALDALEHPALDGRQPFGALVDAAEEWGTQIWLRVRALEQLSDADTPSEADLDRLRTLAEAPHEPLEVRLHAMVAHALHRQSVDGD